MRDIATDAPATIGHNASGLEIEIEIRLFNSLVRHAGPAGPVHRLTLAAGTTIGEVADLLRLPPMDVFLVLRNGRDVSPGIYGGGRFNRDAVVDDGDVIAFSGPVPYSFGYGAPVV